MRDLHKRHYGLTREVSESYIQAARVCFDRHHNSPIELYILNDQTETNVHLSWQPTDERAKSAWYNKDDATRDGAYACALAATEMMRGLYAIRRMETRSGADYYIGPQNSNEDDLENAFRLEVSGTDGSSKDVDQRLIIKVNQARKGDSNLPAIAAIVGFRVKQIKIRTVEEKNS